jgi:Fe-S cluster biogenesis protein NfuA
MGRYTVKNTFKPGDRVKYIPYHAGGNENHPSVEVGEVTKENDEYVFVRFDGDTHACACNPCTLRREQTVVEGTNKILDA